MQNHYYDLTDEMPDAEGELILTVTPQAYFDTNKCLSDMPMDADVLTELNKLGLNAGEMMDSTLELNSISGHRIYKSDIELSLQNHPNFIKSEEFYSMINEYMEE